MRLAILASGNGTTAEAIMFACREGCLKGKVEVACVIASDPCAGVIAKAHEFLPTSQIYLIELRKYYFLQEKFGRALIATFKKHNVDMFGQYGWMPHTPWNVLQEFSGINQHPGDPVRFGGKGMFGKRVHCARLHFVLCTGHHIYTELRLE